MKILLISPPQWHAYGIPVRPVYPPLGLLQLAALLIAEGHAVQFVDADADGEHMPSILSRIRKSKPDLIGFTATTPTYPAARQWAARIKGITDAPIVIGGSHATAVPSLVLKDAAFDYVVQGEGEKTFGLFVDALNNGSLLSGIPGLWSKTTDAVPPSDFLTEDELNALPLPAWQLLQNPEGYRPPDAAAIPVGTIAGTRGCPGTCRYCQAPSLAGRIVRYFSPGRVVEQAWHVHRTIGCREIHIIDDCFTANKRKAMETIHLLTTSGPPVSYVFGNGVRADMLDEELLKSLKAMGVHTLGFGIETACPSIARTAGKPLDLKKTEEVVLSAYSMGFSIWAFFMLGLPGESVVSVKKTVKYACTLPLDVAKFEIFTPYPGTELYTELSDRGRITDNSWRNWGIHTRPVHRLETMTIREIMVARQRAVLRFYLRPGLIARHLRRIRSSQGITLNFSALRFLVHTIMNT